MSLQQPAQSVASSVPAIPTPALMTDRHLVALSKLNAAYDRSQLVAMMIADDNLELSHVLTAFLNGLEEQATCVRVRQPQADSLAAMQEINCALGFDPKDLSLADLQSVLTMFLEYQNTHRRKTVLCIERADEQCSWLLDCIVKLIRSTKSSKVQDGLVVVLSASNSSNDALRNTTFESIRKMAGTPIRLAPFSLAETTEFVRQKTGVAGLGDIQSVFELEAVERLHKISGGIPRKAARLCHECLLLIESEATGRVSGRTVVKAARILRLEGDVDMVMEVVPNPSKRDSVDIIERLVIRCGENVLLEFPLYPGRYMIGRTKTADICLPSPSISRRHALAIKTNDALQILDLGSINGTFAGEERIEEITLTPGVVLKMGDCELEYAIS